MAIPLPKEVYNDITDSNILDSKSRHIIKLSELIINRISETLKIPKSYKYFLDQDDIWIKNFDLIVSVLNIYAFYFWPNSDKILSDVKNKLIDSFWLLTHSWTERWEVINVLSKALDLQVFSFEIGSDIHKKILDMKIPYELCFWIDNKFIDDSINGSVWDKQYKVDTVKSYTWYWSNSEWLIIYNTYWKRLNKNKFTVLHNDQLLENFNVSKIWYIFFPKTLLWKDNLDFIKLNQWLTQNWQEAMRRGMWNWEAPNELMTRDMVAEFILYNKKRNFLS